MQPESSDGFASVGTILPKEGAALLPGGSFRFFRPLYLPVSHVPNREIGDRTPWFALPG
jgi:hypothetical protein